MVLLCLHRPISFLLIVVGISIFCCGIAFDVNTHHELPSLHVYSYGLLYIGAGTTGLLAQQKSKYRKIFSGANLALGTVCILFASVMVIYFAHYKLWDSEESRLYPCSINKAVLCTYVSGIVLAFISIAISFDGLCCKICNNQMVIEDNDDVVVPPSEVYYSRDTEQLVVNTNNQTPQMRPPSYETVMQECAF